jgi:hypothetical protein
MKELTIAEQERLIEFAKFFKSYNPEYRMADGMKAQFLKLRTEVEKIIDKVYHVE